MSRGHRLAAALIVVALLGVAAAGIGMASTGRLGLGAFLVLVSGFHLLEFVVTALLRPAQLCLASFAFNGRAYAFATALALCEHLLEAERFTALPGRTLVIGLGVGLALAGLLVRLWAMLTAAEFFNHVVQSRLRSEHELVQDGPYRWLRHPSYTGYYWFALGTQLVLLNPVALILYALILARYFRHRIPFEESALVQRFGRAYETFRATRRLLIPGTGV